VYVEGTFPEENSAFTEEWTSMCKLPQMDHSCPFIEANSMGSLCLVRTSNQDVLGIQVLYLGPTKLGPLIARTMPLLLLTLHKVTSLLNSLISTSH